MEVVAFLLTLAALWYFETTRTFALVITVILIAVIGVIFTYTSVKYDKELADKRRKNEEAAKAYHAALSRAKDKITALVDHHESTLALRRATLLQVDRYGVVDGAAWSKEVQHFADKVVLPTLSDEEVTAVVQRGLKELFQELIEDRLASLPSKLNQKFLPSDLSPLEFEVWVAERFQEQGWNARTTAGSGDQGADVIATCGSLTIVVQCKLYSGSVGNKAVQEAFTAQTHYGATKSAVVTTGQFTPAAKQVANTTGVHLLHYTELSGFITAVSPVNAA